MRFGASFRCGPIAASEFLTRIAPAMFMLKAFIPSQADPDHA
jgi:hypothetical protein